MARHFWPSKISQYQRNIEQHLIFCDIPGIAQLARLPPPSPHHTHKLAPTACSRFYEAINGQVARCKPDHKGVLCAGILTFYNPSSERIRSKLNVYFCTSVWTV